MTILTLNLFTSTYYSNSERVYHPEQIRDGWLRHIYSDQDTPFVNERNEPENYLWVSNQQAFDLMSHGIYHRPRVRLKTTLTRT